MRLLAFDISSTNIGYISAIDDQPLSWGLISVEKYKAIHWRLYYAAETLRQLAALHRPERIIIEAPIQGPGAYALIQQQRMAGVVMLCCYTGLPAIEVYPVTAKKALTGNGGASKAGMMRYAESVLGVAVSEHEADALGVLYAGWQQLQEERLKISTIKQRKQRKAA